MPQDIHLDGAEISVIKSLGLGGSEIDGKTLMERCADLDFAELADTIKSLMMQGYVDGDTGSMSKQEDFEKMHFRVNSGYSKELKEALDPKPQEKKSKRVRRE